MTEFVFEFVFVRNNSIHGYYNGIILFMDIIKSPGNKVINKL